MYAHRNLENRVAELEKTLRLIKTKHEQLEGENAKLKAEIQTGKHWIQWLSSMNSTSVGTTYVRWGRTECPETSELVYQGRPRD